MMCTCGEFAQWFKIGSPCEYQHVFFGKKIAAMEPRGVIAFDECNRAGWFDYAPSFPQSSDLVFELKQHI